jgi:hypothetical protein
VEGAAVASSLDTARIRRVEAVLVYLDMAAHLLQSIAGQRQHPRQPLALTMHPLLLV